jgi:hypothetical protein
MDRGENSSRHRAAGGAAVSDRELLELAAKAGGIDYKPDNKDWKHDDHCAFWSYDDLCTCGARWNPRDDDGDALRLAVKLRLEPRFIDNSHSNGIEPSRVTLHNISGIVETVGDDSYAATRRAITRAAAEIGRNMT